MIPTVQQADAFRAATRRHLDDIQTAVLDLIDCGTPDTLPTARPPTARDRAATDRTDGRYEPTPPGRTRRTGRSDPTGRAVERWEADVQQTVTRMFAVVSAVEDVTVTLGLTPLDEHGEPLARPAEPGVRRTADGAWRINVSPPVCRRAALDAVGWLRSAADVLTDRMRGVDDPDVGDHLLDRAALVTALLRSEVRRLVPAPPVRRATRPCVGPSCDRQLELVKGSRECERCRSRRRRAAS